KVDGIPSDDHMETQNRLDEISVDKDSIEKVMEKWNLLGISNISCIKNTRQKLLKARIKEHSTDNVINAIGNI
ncbi:hypothetical protein Q604_UNBC09823G0001, partial [human gut metagenome]